MFTDTIILQMMEDRTRGIHMKVETPNIVTSKPILGQIIGTSVHVTDNHKVLYLMSFTDGREIGKRWTTQHLKIGDLVRVRGNVYDVLRIGISQEDGMIAHLLAY
jgi:hypothetical protein